MEIKYLPLRLIPPESESEFEEFLRRAAAIREVTAAVNRWLYENEASNADHRA